MDKKPRKMLVQIGLLMAAASVIYVVTYFWERIPPTPAEQHMLDLVKAAIGSANFTQTSCIRFAKETVSVTCKFKAQGNARFDFGMAASRLGGAGWRAIPSKAPSLILCRNFESLQIAPDPASRGSDVVVSAATFPEDPAFPGNMTSTDRACSELARSAR